MAALGRPLDILRVDIPTPQDDQVLEPARDEELAVAQEAEVPGPEERTPVVTGQARAHGLAGLLRTPPVALRDARPRDPDLADAALGAGALRHGIDDRDEMALGGTATADERRGRSGGGRIGDLAAAERVRVDRQHGRPATRGVARNEEGRLGQAVARQERLGPES